MLHFDQISQSFVINVKSSLQSNHRNEDGTYDKNITDRHLRFELDGVQNMLMTIAEKYPD